MCPDSVSVSIQPHVIAGKGYSSDFPNMFQTFWTSNLQ